MIFDSFFEEMGKLAKGREDTRGLKAKAQKAEARRAKDAKVAAEKQKIIDAEWEKVDNRGCIVVLVNYC